MCINKKRQIRVVNLIREHCGRKYIFGNSYISRPYIDFQNVRYAKRVFSALKQIWKNQNVIILEGEFTRLGVGNNLFDNVSSIRRILAPPENAYDYYDSYISHISDIYNGELVLIALGPTATVLASDLSKLGIWAIDIGHIDIEYEWFLKRVKEKVAIEGKYTNEVNDGNVVDEVIDSEYENQIICKIGC